MPRSKVKVGRAPRVRNRKVSESVEFPRWILAASVLFIGLLLLLGAVSDVDGNLRKPGVGGYLYAAAVFGLAAGLVFIHRKGPLNRRKAPVGPARVRSRRA